VDAVEFGLFFINEKAPGVSEEQVMADALEQCRVADELGFDALWLGEHHFAPYGTMADTMVFAGAVSQVTKRIPIGTAVIVPTFQHPVRVAEQVAMLDLLSGGRFRLGVGRGYQQREFRGYGVPQNESKARFRESVTIIEGLLRNDSFSYQGEFWTVDDLTIAPRPVREIPIYVAVSRTPESFEWAVEKGYGVMAGNPYSIDAGTSGAQEMYVAAQRKAGQLESMGKAWGLLNNVLVNENSQAAREMFRRTWEIGNQYLWKWARVVEEGQELPEDYKYFDGWMDWIKDEQYENIWSYDGTLVGSPDEIVERLHKLWEMQGPLDKYIIWMNRGGCIPQKEVLHSMELFATKVMPQVRNLRADAG
jgi:alkanesulfonate monooxygenase SsuD/methylene tetrahydromethanopterin reductase-like flavin-dependent oxidoreductase (luciferase family)